MGRYDQFIRFDRQTGIYRPEQIRVFEWEHMTGAAGLFDISNLNLFPLRD